MPFDAHSCAGTAFDVIAGDETGAAAAFRPDDPDLADYVILEFDAFEWREEDEAIVSHPHDPFGRIDVLRSSRHVRVELDGRLLAESSRPMLLFETLLPLRFYLPREDVVGPARAQRHGQLLRVQGPRVLLLGAGWPAPMSRGRITSRCTTPSLCATGSASSTNTSTSSLTASVATVRSRRGATDNRHAFILTPSLMVARVGTPSTTDKLSGGRMRAVTWQGRRKVSVDNVPDPAIKEPNDAIIRVTSTNICGSDLHLYEVLGAFMSPGDILGHEAMGVVEEVGREVDNLTVGDRVVIPFNICCGHCFMCDHGLQSQCETTQNRDQGTGAALFGYSKLYGEVAGGQAEYLRVPQAQYTHIKVPDDGPDERYVYLSDVLPTAWQAVEYADVPDGGTLVVLGLGPIGSMACRIASHRKDCR